MDILDNIPRPRHQCPLIFWPCFPFIGTVPVDIFRGVFWECSFRTETRGIARLIEETGEIFYAVRFIE